MLDGLRQQGLVRYTDGVGEHAWRDEPRRMSSQTRRLSSQAVFGGAADAGVGAGPRACPSRTAHDRAGPFSSLQPRPARSGAVSVVLAVLALSAR